MRSNKFLLSAALVALTAVGPMATTASAQLANASASTLGLSSNNTATVRGFGAISVNPRGASHARVRLQPGDRADAGACRPRSGHPE